MTVDELKSEIQRLRAWLQTMHDNADKVGEDHSRFGSMGAAAVAALVKETCKRILDGEDAPK